MSQERQNGALQEQSNVPRNPEMKIAGVNITEYRSGIPLSGFDSVASALHTFSTGRSGSSRATKDDLEGNVARMGGAMGMGIFLLATAGQDRSTFVERMLQEAQPAVNGNGRWSRHYDYDGQGVFHKTTVELTKLPEQEDAYLLGLNAAYVGKEVEDGLAETLGVEQGLQWKGVNVVLEPEGSNFRIDFDQVADRLQDIYAELEPAPTPEPRGFRQRLVEAVRKTPTENERLPLTGERIIQELLTTDGHRDSNSVVLGIKDGVEVSVGLGRVGDRFNWKGGNRDEELWRAEGTVLTGPLAESYERDGQLEAPSVSFSVKRYSEDRYDRLPAIDPAMKTTMNELASKIAASFTSVA